MADLLELLVPDAPAWRSWLEQHHDVSPGVWLVLTKKGGTATQLTYDGALQEALCFGWMDGQGRRRDEATSLQRMTPRTARSRWSARNVGLVAELEAAGRLHPAGEAAIAAARADGRWAAAYDGPATAVPPADLLAAVAAVPEAQAMWDVLTSTNRFALIHRHGALKRADTRERRIGEYVEMLARQETPHPQRARPR